MDGPIHTALDEVERVVAEPLRFKAKLAIGENAYASLRMVNRGREIWDVVGAMGTGAAVAKSSLVASAFFAPSGLMGALGIGAATTPIGWVAFAALASGGACYGLYRWLGDTKGSRVIEIPKFLNTPLDTLGLALFDLIAPLALRLAAVDGEIEPAERAALVAHLVDEWGLDAGFVTRAIEQLEPAVGQGTVDEVAAELSAFLHANPDCNHQAIAADLGQFLRQLLEAGGPLSEAEEAALASSLVLLGQEPDGALSRAWVSARSSAKDAAEWARERLPGPDVLGAVAGKAWQGAKTGVEQLGTTAREAAGWTRERLPTPEELQAAARTTALQVEQAAREAASWAQEKAPAAASQVQEVARRSVDLAKAGIERLRKRSG